MDNEPEVTRAQLDETRASLSEKLESLEQHVVDSVQSAAAAVTKTVENVKVAVADSMECVQNTFDLKLQVKRRPWGMVAGSIALGYVGGYLLSRIRPARSMPEGWSQSAPSDSLRLIGQQNGVLNGQGAIAEPSARKLFQGDSHSESLPSWLSKLTNQFGPEITTLKGLAIGTVLSAVRDLMARSVAEQMKPHLAGVMDKITVKLGGEPTPGPVVNGGSFARGDERHEISSQETRRPSGASRQNQTAAGTVV
jgi:hypothetical protein